jgi:hypothetical protein
MTDNKVYNDYSVSMKYATKRPDDGAKTNKCTNDSTQHILYDHTELLRHQKQIGAYTASRAGPDSYKISEAYANSVKTISS